MPAEEDNALDVRGLRGLRAQYAPALWGLRARIGLGLHKLSTVARTEARAMMLKQLSAHGVDAGDD
jgi:hypothetical protein